MSKPKTSYRYPGVTPFSRDQSHIFFGRDKDTAQLKKLVDRQKLVVLYGKSGLGKSSLVNAGLIPQIEQEDHYTPIIIRFGAWTENSAQTPLATSKKALGELKNSFLTNLLTEDDSLWLYVKNYQISEGKTPLLIFDQFEELFSYPEEAISKFKHALNELLYTDIPLRFLRKIDSAKLSDEQEDLLEEALHPRLLLAIRSDRLHLLDRLQDRLPNILRHCYELQALSLADAATAIRQPALLQGAFKTTAFSYSDAAIQHLLGYLKDPETQQVEGILIQMLCEHYERKIVAKQELKQLEKKHIGNPAEVVKSYYKEKINGLAKEQQLAAKKLIEDGLVSKGEGMRLSLHEAYIAEEYRVNKQLLKQLVDNRLLRSEPFLRGGYTYELSHDRLVAAVIEARNIRETQEQQEKQRLEAEQLRAAADAAKKEERKAKKQFRTVLALLIAALVALFVAVFYYYDLQEQKRQLAEKEREKEREQYMRFLAEAKHATSNKEYDDAIESYTVAKLFTTDSLAINTAIKALEKQIDREKQFDTEMQLADSLFQQPMYEDAIQHYQAAHKLLPNEPALKTQLQVITTALKEEKRKAIENANAVSSFDRKAAAHYNQLANELSKHIAKIEHLVNLQ